MNELEEETNLSDEQLEWTLGEWSRISWWPPLRDIVRFQSAFLQEIRQQWIPTMPAPTMPYNRLVRLPHENSYRAMQGIFGNQPALNDAKLVYHFSLLQVNLVHASSSGNHP